MLRRERYDVAIDLQGLVKSAAFARLSGAATGHRVRPASTCASGPASFFYYRARPSRRRRSRRSTRTCRCSTPLGIADRLRAASRSRCRRRRRSSRSPTGWRATAGRASRWSTRARGGRTSAGRPSGSARWRRGSPSAHGLLPVVLWGPGEQDVAARIVDRSRDAAIAGAEDGRRRPAGALARRAADAVGRHRAAAPRGGGRHADRRAVRPDRSRAKRPVGRRGHLALAVRRLRVPLSRDAAAGAGPCIEDISVDEVREAIDRRLAAAEHHA